MFIPHKFDTKVRGVPTIQMSQKAHDDIAHLVDIVDTEVGWLGTTEFVRDRDGTLNILIDEIFLPRQECHATTTELTPEGIAEISMTILAEDKAKGISHTDPKFRLPRLLFWGHSHVRMGVSASGQDDLQVTKFKENGAPHFVRGIFNKKGDAQFTTYFFDQAFEITDCPWQVVASADDTRRKFWQDRVGESVRTLGYQGGYKANFAAQNPHAHTPYSHIPYGGDHSYRTPGWQNPTLPPVVPRSPASLIDISEKRLWGPDYDGGFGG